MSEATTQERAAYQHGHDRPLGSFTGLLGAYAVAAGALGVAVRRRGTLPERIGLADLALLGVATHKLARLIAKDPITSPLRAPFTSFEGTSGEAELQEEVRGTGVRKALGELVTCPFCVGQWVATGFVVGIPLAPRATRLIAAVFTTLSVSDYLQFLYARVQQSQS